MKSPHIILLLHGRVETDTLLSGAMWSVESPLKLR